MNCLDVETVGYFECFQVVYQQRIDFDQLFYKIAVRFEKKISSCINE